MIQDLKAFIRPLDRHVRATDPEAIPRWRVVKGCVQVWSIVMRERGESKEDALRRAWTEFVGNYTEENCTDLLLWCMGDALRDVVPGLLEEVEASYDRACGVPEEPSPEPPTPEELRQRFRVLS